jgi:hypothetical protein
MSLQDVLKRLTTDPDRGNGRLPFAQSRDPIESVKSISAAQENSSDGIASPVTENKESDGEAGYLPSRIYVQDGGADKVALTTSSDGLYTFEHKVLSQIKMTDANNQEVVFVFQDVDPDTGAAYPD